RQYRPRLRGRPLHRDPGDHPRPDVPPRFGRRHMSDAVVFENVDIVFGDKHAEVLALVDQGKNRDEISAETGIVVGVADASLTIREGEILVLMGLSGSGKSTLLRAVNGLAPVARGSVLVSTENGTVDPYTAGARKL